MHYPVVGSTILILDVRARVVHACMRMLLVARMYLVCIGDRSGDPNTAMYIGVLRGIRVGSYTGTYTDWTCYKMWRYMFEYEYSTEQGVVQCFTCIRVPGFTRTFTLVTSQ